MGILFFFEFLVRVYQLRTIKDNEPFTILWAWHWHGMLSWAEKCGQKGHGAWDGVCLCFMFYAVDDLCLFAIAKSHQYLFSIEK